MPLCPPQLPPNIDSIINRPEYSRFHWGILVKSDTRTLYAHDAHKFFIPASNAKLLTTAAALQQLGANYRIRTSVYWRNGTLRVLGRGDPSLTDVQLQQLAKQLYRHGIRQVKRLVADDSYFRGEIVNSSWEWGDLLADYGAPVDSLILNENTVSFQVVPQAVGQPLRLVWKDPAEARFWRVVNDSQTGVVGESASVDVNRELRDRVLRITGKLSVDAAPKTIALAVVDPVAHFIRHFRTALAREGISVAMLAVGGGGNDRELATVESPPVSQLLLETNQNSNNLYAEVFLREIGAKNLQSAIHPTIDVGLSVLQKTLTSLGVDVTGYSLVDGSGLSRHNLVSPEALVQTLQAMAKSPAAAVFRATLPLAGRSGTLKSRFRSTPAEGIVSAKTGTVSGIVSLSGYVNVPEQPLVFSIIVNQSDQSAQVMRQAIDEIVVLLSQLRRC